MFSTDSYSTVRGVDMLIPVDVYLPGCPPKPEAVIDAITKLRKKISRELYEDRIRSQISTPPVLVRPGPWSSVSGLPADKISEIFK
ncbi:hypothetical protein KY284_032525 [Solanum tuberosum]|nr:hypothetical protein KY284_032525 [Solanum tuberosum]